MTTLSYIFDDLLLAFDTNETNTKSHIDNTLHVTFTGENTDKASLNFARETKDAPYKNVRLMKIAAHQSTENGGNGIIIAKQVNLARLETMDNPRFKSLGTASAFDVDLLQKQPKD